MVRCEKLSDPSLNRIFNVLPIGVKYTLSIQRTNFDLKCLLDPEKHGVNIGLKTMFNFGELYFIEAIHNANCISSVTLMDHKKQNLSLYSLNIARLQ